MKKFNLVCIGKIKNRFWQDACSHYQSLLKPWCQMRYVELKDRNLPIPLRKKQEGQQIMNYIQSQDYAIALDEKGKLLSSPQIARILENCQEKLQKSPLFIIGGPYGLPAEVLDRCDLILSLSPMTFPHEMARVILLEQIYRAESILRGTPYHHAQTSFHI